MAVQIAPAVADGPAAEQGRRADAAALVGADRRGLVGPLAAGLGRTT
ncbi:hypothetical protein [Kitasatospora albolonga]